MKDVVELLVSIDGRPTVAIKGRNARCLHTLLQASEKGVSPATDDPMPRWSHYVFCLRSQFGAVIETITEKHGGPYAGTHARYVLRSRVEVHRVIRAGEKRHAA